MKHLRLWAFGAILSAVMLMTGCSSKLLVMDPKGPNARSIAHLINWSLVWMALVIIVVISLYLFIILKYREKPENMDYEPPEEHGNAVLEVIWTSIPILIVIALTIPTVKTLYSLEKPPAGYEDKKPLVIHVTSADWKWIFSYPEQGIETINYVNIPAGVPVDFRLTSAGTMGSFWVPALGGQKYTMGKMETQLYLTADQPGSYFGRNTNFNGRGYADMEFEVQAETQADFDKWVQEVKNTAPKLTEDKYTELLKPGHLGRETFSNTHLAWVDNADPNSKSYTFPELYETHDYPGKTFDTPDNVKNGTSGESGGKVADSSKETSHDHNMSMNMDMSSSNQTTTTGGEH